MVKFKVIKQETIRFGDWIVSMESVPSVSGKGSYKFLGFLNVKSRSRVSLSTFSPYASIIDETKGGERLIIGGE